MTYHALTVTPELLVGGTMSGNYYWLMDIAYGSISLTDDMVSCSPVEDIAYRIYILD